MNIEIAEKRVEKIIKNADKMIWNQLPLSRDDYEAINILLNYTKMAEKQLDLDYVEKNFISIEKIKAKKEDDEKMRDVICKMNYDENRVKTLNERILAYRELLEDK